MDGALDAIKMHVAVFPLKGDKKRVKFFEIPMLLG